jgi:hypothetical protein
VKYLCLVYGEAKGDALPRQDSADVADEGFDELGELARSSHYIAAARLQPAESAVTVRVRDGSVFISDGPPEAKECLGAFYLVEARDLNDAIRIAAKMPGARLGWIEVRPLMECNYG